MLTSTLDARNRWLILAGLALLGFVLGYVGLHRMAIDANGDSSVLTLIYRDLALVSFSSGNAGSGVSIPWTYQVARFLLPIVVIYGAFAGLVMLFRDRFQQVRLPFARRHTVVVGLGEMGLAFAESMCRAGEEVVSIEADAGHPNIAVARAEGIIVVTGDARDRAVLVSARLHKASHLIATADDAVNLEVLVAAQEVVLTRGASVDCLAHATDADVCALLKQQVLESDRDTRFRVDFFNYYDQAARLLFRREPPDGDVTVVIGSGRLADAVVLAASAIVGDGSREGSGPVVVVSPDASARVAALRLRHRGILGRVDVTAMDLALDPVLLRTTEIVPRDAGSTRIYVCDDSSAANVALTLALRSIARLSATRVVVCSDRTEGLSILFADATKSDIAVVRLGTEICTPDLVEQGIFELIARSMHSAYRRARRLEGNVSLVDDSMRLWHDLPETLRSSNRAQAAHVGTKLDLIGCGLVPLEGAEGRWFRFSAEEIEQLAEMEHERWVTERRADGWRPGIERDARRKRTPYLVEWDELPEPIRDRDRETIVQLPARLEDAGYEIVRLSSEQVSTSRD